MFFYIDHLIQLLILPPGCILVLGLLGLVTWRYSPKLGKSILALSIVSLWVLSMPLTAQQLIDKLQYKYPALSANQLTADKNTAIVVLEASLNLNTPEYGEPTVSENTLARIRYAAFLHKKTKLPILVSGNDPVHPDINQADYMANALKEYFSVPTRWKEDKGFNTAKEGIFSAEILKKDGITKIYLVTHALHMPRAVYAFENRGLTVIPAPTGYKHFERTLGKTSTLLPSMEALHVTSAALREYIGLAWYKVYYR